MPLDSCWILTACWHTVQPLGHWLLAPVYIAQWGVPSAFQSRGRNSPSRPEWRDGDRVVYHLGVTGLCTPPLGCQYPSSAVSEAAHGWGQQWHSQLQFTHEWKAGSSARLQVVQQGQEQAWKIFLIIKGIRNKIGSWTQRHPWGGHQWQLCSISEAGVGEQLLSPFTSAEGREGDAAKAAWSSSGLMICNVWVIIPVLFPPRKEGTHLQHWRKPAASCSVSRNSVFAMQWCRGENQLLSMAQAQPTVQKHPGAALGKLL